MSDRRPAPMLANAAVLVGSRLVVALLGWFGTVLIVRSLGPSEFGKFAFVFGLLATLSIVTSIGISRVALAGMLEPGADRGHVAGAYIALRSLLGLIGYGIGLGFVILLDYDPDVVHAVAVAGLVVVLATPSSALNVIFQADGRLGPIAAAGIIGQWAQVALTIALVLGPATLVWLTVPAVLNEMVSLTFKARVARRLVPFRLVVDVGQWRRMMREAVPLTLGLGMATMYQRLDLLMLSRLASFDTVGAYGVALKFSDLLQILPTALSAALLPVLVTAWPARMDVFRDAVRDAAVVLAFCAGGAVGAFAVFSGPGITLLVGDEFGSAAGVTTMLVVAQSLSFVTSVAFTCLVAAGRHGSYPVVALSGLVLNVSLNLLLIPRYSMTGAAAASIATHALVASMLGLLASRIPGLGTVVPWRLLRLVPAVALMILVGRGLDAFMLWPLAAVAAGAGYVLSCFGLRIISVDLFAGVFRRERPDAASAAP